MLMLSALVIAGCSAQEVSVSETAGEPVQNEGSTLNQEKVAQVEEATPTDEPTIQPTDKPTNTPSPTNTPKPVYVLPDLGSAPDITNETWINADPHTLEDLRGKVVLVEFWTFG